MHIANNSISFSQKKIEKKLMIFIQKLLKNDKKIVEYMLMIDYFPVFLISGRCGSGTQYQNRVKGILLF